MTKPHLREATIDTSTIDQVLDQLGAAQDLVIAIHITSIHAVFPGYRALRVTEEAAAELIALGARLKTL